MPSHEDLHLILRRKVQDLTGTVRRDGEVPQRELAELERLSRLAELAESVKPEPRTPRWPIVGLVFLIFLGVGLLLLLRVSPIEVELDLLVSSASFKPLDSRQITEVLALSELSSPAADVLELPATLASPQPVRLQPPVVLRVPQGANGGFGLSPVIVPPSLGVRITRAGPQSYQIALGEDAPRRHKQAALALQLVLAGRIEVVSQGQVKIVDIGRPKAASLRSLGRPLRLDFQTSAAPFELLPDIRISSLEFSRDLVEVLDGHRAARAASSVISGTLYNESMYGHSSTLRRGEWLDLGGLTGEIRSLRADKEGLRIDFHGWAEEVSVGSGPNRRSLLPSRLEWLSKRHGLVLLWGTVVSLYTLIVGVLRWWRKPAL